ncbi:MAG: hypothetical protein HZC23_04050 [Rhodocyclales bacterium]|nr:hypothetical protein [Rhodocyclales bacterium]
MNKILLYPILALMLAGCVNLHVHFPEASGKTTEAAPAGAAGAEAK